MRGAQVAHEVEQGSIGEVVDVERVVQLLAQLEEREQAVPLQLAAGAALRSRPCRRPGLLPGLGLRRQLGLGQFLCLPRHEQSPRATLSAQREFFTTRSSTDGTRERKRPTFSRLTTEATTEEAATRCRLPPLSLNSSVSARKTPRPLEARKVMP